MFWNREEFFNIYFLYQRFFVSRFGITLTLRLSDLKIKSRGISLSFSNFLIIFSRETPKLSPSRRALNTTLGTDNDMGINTHSSSQHINTACQSVWLSLIQIIRAVFWRCWLHFVGLFMTWKDFEYVYGTMATLRSFHLSIIKLCDWTIKISGWPPFIDVWFHWFGQSNLVVRQQNFVFGLETVLLGTSFCCLLWNFIYDYLRRF